MENAIGNRLKCRIEIKRLVLLLFEVIALGIIAAYASRYFSFAESCDIVLALGAGYLVPRLMYSQSKMRCNWGQWILLAVGLLLALYVIHSLKVWTTHESFTLEEPELHSDDGQYYSWALAHYDGRCPTPKLSFKGLPLFMLGLWKVLGVSVVWPMALNYMFALLSIVITGKISHRVLSHHFPTIKPSTISACAMLMVPLLGFLVSQNLRIQKEAGCTLGIVMVGYCLAGFAERNNLTKNEKRRDLAVFVIGTVILALVRTNFAYFAMIGAAMMALARHHAQWKRGSLLALIALAITVVFSILFSYTFGQQYRTVDGGDAMARAFKIGIVQQPYFTLIGDYYHYPEWKRLLLLPITAGVQYIIPFPWLYDLENADIMSILPRMRVMWYFVGGTCIYYYLYINGLHYKQNNLGMWAWWPLVTFLGIAFITGGSVSRYVLPLQPLFVVIALYVLLQVKIGNYRRSFAIWMAVYVLMLIATLILCYHTQVEYFNSLDEYYRLKAKHLLK